MPWATAVVAAAAVLLLLSGQHSTYVLFARKTASFGTILLYLLLGFELNCSCDFFFKKRNLLQDKKYIYLVKFICRKKNV